MRFPPVARHLRMPFTPAPVAASRMILRDRLPAVAGSPSPPQATRPSCRSIYAAAASSFSTAISSLSHFALSPLFVSVLESAARSFLHRPNALWNEYPGSLAFRIFRALRSILFALED
jgi:hypothetical protein